jgi:hypothetical protein
MPQPTSDEWGLAEKRFVLARALTQGERGERDPDRARSLAQQAQSGFASVHDARRAAEVGAWLQRL